MVNKFAKGAIPPAGEPSDLDRELAQATLAMIDTYCEQMEAFSFNRALQAVWEVISRANKYIVANEPWVLVKNPLKAGQLATMLYSLLESLRLITLVIRPVMPGTADKMAHALNTGKTTSITEHSKWGLTVPGTELQEAAPLFPRLDTNKQGQQTSKQSTMTAPETTSPVEPQDLLSFEQFQKLDLRVAEVVNAEKIAKSDRLLKLTVKSPEERTVVAGIAQHYAPEELIGRQVILVANLKPAKLMGVLSHGMVLAAKDGDRLVLTGPSSPMPPGSKIS